MASKKDGTVLKSRAKKKDDGAKLINLELHDNTFFKALMEAIKDLIKEFQVVIDPEKFTIQTMDSAHVSYIDIGILYVRVSFERQACEPCGGALADPKVFGAWVTYD